MSRQGLAQNDQNCNFWAKLCRFRAKKHNFYWRKQKFWYPHITEKPPMHIVCIIFWSGMGRNEEIVWPKTEISGPKLNGPKISILAKKSDIFHTTQILVNDPFVALRETVHFLLGNDFSTFRSRVTAVFVKKTWLNRPKVFPLPTVGAPSSSNSPSALNMSSEDPSNVTVDPMGHLDP